MHKKFADFFLEGGSEPGMKVPETNSPCQMPQKHKTGTLWSMQVFQLAENLLECQQFVSAQTPNQSNQDLVHAFVAWESHG